VRKLEAKHKEHLEKIKEEQEQSSAQSERMNSKM